MRIGAVTIGVAVVLVVAVGAALYLSPRPPGASLSTSAAQGATTLETIVTGRYPTALDKRGTGGVTVTVRDLLVLYVRDESDGDWHVGVTDGNISIFITEITPSYQQALGRPVVGTVIDETGIAYCDTFHQAEAWHGNTCWEIHPITSWQLSAGNPIVHSKSYAGSNLNAAFAYAENPIARGSVQTITIHVTDSEGIIAGVPVAVQVDYASGLTTKSFQCTTGSDGNCKVSWQIGSTSDPGTFTVKATVVGLDFSSSFEVTS
jgi:hypothetical protein